MKKMNVGRYLSEKSDVIVGVNQGSALSSLLYAIVTNKINGEQLA